MSGDSRFTLRRGAAVGAAVALLAAGAGAMYLAMRAARPEAPALSAEHETRAALPQAADIGSASDADAPLPDVVVPLTQAAARRAGVVTAPVTADAAASTLELPGLVEPNAYRQVAVTPLVAGRVTRVSAELGDTVRRNQTMAQIYSPELAEAQTRYVSARAMLDAHERELERTERLLAIGAASRQELERIHAEHAAQTAAVESARSQLELLGVPPAALERLAAGREMSATTSVPAPIAGVVTERMANVGLNVDPGAKLFTVVDLSTVWVVADLYERDFRQVRVGHRATVTTTAYPDLHLEGRVTYIDPQVNPATRTAKLRVELANPRAVLRLGMYADVRVAGAGGTGTASIPKNAVQNIGDRTVVYIVAPGEAGKFIEREVRLGRTSENRIEVLSGLKPGDVVVTDGSFSLRAERERLGLRPAAPPHPRRADSESSAPDRMTTAQAAKIVVNQQGFEPAEVTVRAGAPVRLTFLRTTDKTCGTEVVFPSLNIRRTLPLNGPVVIEFTPAKSGTIAFACGMNMFHGTIVVE